jgi:hypothetical protein
MLLSAAILDTIVEEAERIEAESEEELFRMLVLAVFMLVLAVAIEFPSELEALRRLVLLVARVLPNEVDELAT